MLGYLSFFSPFCAAVSEQQAKTICFVAQILQPEQNRVQFMLMFSK